MSKDTRSPFLILAEAADAIAAQCRAAHDAGADLALPTNALLLSPESAAVALELSRDTIYKLMRAGDLPSLHIGTNRRIRREDLVEYARKRLAEEGRPVRLVKGASR